MPNMFGGPQDHPEYTGTETRARSRHESVSKGVLYRLVGSYVERQVINGEIVRYSIDDDQLPAHVRKRFMKTLELQRKRRR